MDTFTLRIGSMSDVSALVRIVRAQAGITQRELAGRLHKSQGYVSRIEREQRVGAGLDELIDIAHACGQRLLVGSAPRRVELG